LLVLSFIPSFFLFFSHAVVGLIVRPFHVYLLPLSLFMRNLPSGKEGRSSACEVELKSPISRGRAQHSQQRALSLSLPQLPQLQQSRMERAPPPPKRSRDEEGVETREGREEGGRGNEGGDELMGGGRGDAVTAVSGQHSVLSREQRTVQACEYQ